MTIANRVNFRRADLISESMTDRTHLDEINSATAAPLSRRLVEAFRDAVRDPALTKADHVQRLKDELEAALDEEQPDAARRPDNP